VNDDTDRDVQGAAVLAKGRVLCAQGRVPECMQALQEVDRRTAAFPNALFELAWAHYKAGDLAGGARTLDILLMTSPEGELALQTNALRGRILTRLNDQDGAQESYQVVSDTLGPVAAELDRLLQEPKSMKACFDFVLDRKQDSQASLPPITERTMKWLETDHDMGSLVGMFGDLRQQRDDVRESLQIVESLLWVLRSGGQLEAFPALKERYLRLKEAEGLAVRASVDAVRAVRPVIRARIAGDLLARYDRAIRATDDASRSGTATPVTLDEYRQREKALTKEIEDLGREVFLIDSLVGIQRQQVVAMEQWLQEQRFAKDGPSISGERESGLRSELGSYAGALDRFGGEVIALRERLSRESLTVNTPETLRAEDIGRNAQMRAALAEAQVLKDASPGLEVSARDVAGAATGLVGRSAVGLSEVGPVVASLMEVAGRGARDFEAAVLREKSRLEESVVAFQKAELDAEALSETEGTRILHVVRKRLGTVLLEADLGLADMAWQREEKVATQLRDLGKEFGAQMKAVDTLERALKEEEAIGAPPPAAPQAPGPVAP
jgi:tetratricopeptide (TPR) repeat protein